MNAIRKAAVAGRFYPGEPDELRRTLDTLFAQETAQRAVRIPKALISPHAGYIYSGGLAARAFARVRPVREVINRVVLLAPCHHVAVRGFAASSADEFETPFGAIPVDKTVLRKIMAFPYVSIFDETHADEHALEVQLPFLQYVLDDFSIVPLVVGDASNAEVAEVLDTLWGDEKTLIVISSDLSHYLDYASASKLDRETCRAIESCNPDAIRREQACGCIPIKGLLITAKRRGMDIETVDVINSGDTAGTKDRVVGYGAWLFHENTTDETNVNAEADFEASTRSLLNQYGHLFLKIAAASIENGFSKNCPAPINTSDFPEATQATGACFVTLTKNGALRGCIGSSEAHQPLIHDIAINAYKAAFGDPRFPNLQPSELPEIHLSISVLSPQNIVHFKNQTDLLRQLRPGIDGLLISDRGKHSLFLPAVWEKIPDPKIFLSRLKEKAGFPPEYCSQTFEARRFITEDVKQSQLPDPLSLWQSLVREEKNERT